MLPQALLWVSKVKQRKCVSFFWGFSVSRGEDLQEGTGTRKGNFNNPLTIKYLLYGKYSLYLHRRSNEAKAEILPL